MKRVLPRLFGFGVGAGLAFGLLVNSVLATSESAHTEEQLGDEPFVLDGTHTPPLLVTQGESIALTYRLVCPMIDPANYSCDPMGTLFLRSAGESTFRQVELERQPDGSLATRLELTYSQGGAFEYYALLEDRISGLALTLPAGGATAPQHAWVVNEWTNVDVTSHVFGNTRAPDNVVVHSQWGSSDNRLGLSSGIEQSTIGPSSFDVATDGSIVVLDQVNQRLATYSDRQMGVRYIPVDITGGIADIALDSAGNAFVLDNGRGVSSNPIVRQFNAAEGTLVAIAKLGQRTADMIRIGPSGPLVHQYPAEMWAPIGSAAPFLPARAQLARATSGRPVADGLETVVSMSPTEARFALVRGSRVVNAWRVVSNSGAGTIGEAQLVERFNSGLVAVLRLWTEDRAEFQVLELGPNVVTNSFAIDPMEWAEVSALSRFRLAGGRLYQMRSGPDGVDIGVFRLGGAS